MTSTQSPAIETSAGGKFLRHASHRRWDFVLMALAVLLFAALAFVPSLPNPGQRLAPVTPLVAVHGILTTAWLLLFLAQTVLIATGRRTVHRWLGTASVVLAAAIVVVGYKVAIAMTIRGFDLSGDLNVKADPAAYLIFPLGDLLTFIVLLSTGLWFRHQPGTHKRFMLLATVGMMAPASLSHIVGHNLRSMPVLFVPLLAFVFLSPALYDRFRVGRFHRVTLWGGIALFVWGNVRAMIGPGGPWKQFAGWLIR